MTPVEPVDPAGTATGRALPGGGRGGSGAGSPRRGPGPATAWPELLDALEERTRRLAAVVEAKGEASVDAAAVPEVSLTPDGPLPPELGYRARALLAETHRLQDRAVRRMAATERELRYHRN